MFIKIPNVNLTVFQSIYLSSLFLKLKLITSSPNEKMIFFSYVNQSKKNNASISFRQLALFGFYY